MNKELKELAEQAGMECSLGHWYITDTNLERFYEDAVIEGMAKQMHSSVDRAVNTMGKEWVGLTDDEMLKTLIEIDSETVRLPIGFKLFACAIEAKLKEKNND